MGYCYCRGKLVCYGCGAMGATKRPCPFGYCPPPAICEECWAKPEIKKEYADYHVAHGCEARAASIRSDPRFVGRIV